MWFTSKWQPCNKLCGEGKQTRQVICYRKEEDGRITVLDEKDCQDEKPAEETECMIQPCEGVDYIASSWSGVSEIFMFYSIIYYMILKFSVILAERRLKQDQCIVQLKVEKFSTINFAKSA